MLDLRRTTAAPRAARLALAAVLTILCAWALIPAAHAATGELAAFGEYGTAADQLNFAGPVAVDPTDANSIYVGDRPDYSDGAQHQRIRKYGADGTLQATLEPPLDNPSGAPMYIVGLAIDGADQRLYVLLDADDHGEGMAREVLVYSTVPSCPTPSTCTLVAPGSPAAVADGVLIDFRLPAGGSVDYATGLAVDPGTHKVAVLGIDDTGASDPTGVIQYVTSDGALDTRVSGLGAGLDPAADIRNPVGLAIAPDGSVYIPTAPPGNVGDPIATASIFRLPRESGTSTLLAQDSVQPMFAPGFAFGLGTGSSIGVSSDGATVYVVEGDGSGARVRGFSTATGAQSVVYGQPSGVFTASSCYLPNQFYVQGVAAGAGDVVVVTSPAFTANNATDRAVHVFGPGGTGCPRQQALFTVDGRGDGTVTVTKGQPIAFDAGPSQLLGAVPSQVDWDFDGSGAFTTHVTGSPASLSTTHKFLQVGTFQVGVQIHSDGVPPVSDPVFHQVKVVAPTPTAAFKPSTRTPAAGASVTFDASDSTDPAGSDSGGPSHALAKYRWDFGDGQTQETTGPTVAHAFANPGTAALNRTVKLSVLSKDDVASGSVQQTLTVAGTPAAGTPSTPDPPQQQQPVPPGGGGTPPPFTPPSPTVAATSVDAKGVVSLKVTCPAGGATCQGKVELTIKVKTKVKGKTKSTTLKLGTATFTVAAGKSQAVKLKLSAAGRSLLRKQHKLSATAAVTVTAGGKASTKTRTLTLKAPAKKGH
jgi:plastocyanin